MISDDNRDDVLKRLFDRFLQPEAPDDFSSASQTPRKREDRPLSDWRNTVRPVFETRCEPRHPTAPFTSAGLSVFVSQQIRKGGREVSWDSLIIRCDEETNGTITVRVIISNPDWRHWMQIACICSRPGDEQSATALECNLEHEEVPS